MRSVLTLVLAGGVMVALCSPTSAAVLCKKRSGVVVVREACKKKEAPLDLAQFGAVGPTGPAGPTGPPGVPAWERPCPPDSVLAGTTCIDTYEASVWRVPGPTDVNASLVMKIRNGEATAANLAAGGATQLGLSAGYVPCGLNGQNCTDDIYAVSLPGVLPSASITWFQAQTACTNAGKRLPTNGEWQAAVVGTPDPGPDNGTTDCNSNGPTTVANGSRTACVSSIGAFDMVGNLEEWVADWVPPLSMTCGAWGALSPTDMQCFAGAIDSGEPGALRRGGHLALGTDAGPLSVFGHSGLSFADPVLGFRCAR